MKPQKYETRTLDNGTIIRRYPSPVGEGYLYYTDGGPEGMVLIADTQLINISILSSCVAWELDKPYPKHPVGLHPVGLHPSPHFNKQGFCY